MLIIIGIYILVYGFITVKIKQRWYLGEACMSIPFSTHQMLIKFSAFLYGGGYLRTILFKLRKR